MKKLWIVCATVATAALWPDRAAADATVNLREDDSAYTVEIRSPNPDATSVRWTGGALEIRHGDAAQASQQIGMPEAGAGAALNLRRTGDALIVRVEKGGTREAAAAGTPRPVDALRDQMLAQFANVGEQMAQAMNQALEEQGLDSLLAETGLLPKGQPATRFELKDAGRTFVLTAPMTAEEAKTVKIAVENDRLLKITSESQAGSPAAAVFQSSSATQAVTLPQPVKADEVSMNYKDGKLEIVIPKA